MPNAVIQPPQPPSAQELTKLHTVIPALYESLASHRFGSCDPWESSDTAVLDQWMAVNRWPSLEELEHLIRSRFASVYVDNSRPFMWIRELNRYSSGPLAANGIPIAEHRRQAAEMASRAQEIDARAARQKQERDADNAEQQLSAARNRVVQDLWTRGFEVFAPNATGPASCHLVALRPVMAPSVRSWRILISTAAQPRAHRDVCVATIDADGGVAYNPPLE